MRWLLFQIRRWWQGKSTKEPVLPPHQQWPEILHWREGDRFNNLHGLRRSQYSLITVDDDGYAAVDFCGEREWVLISSLVGHNTSLRTRRVNDTLSHSREYMELIKEFQKSYRELEERDRRMKIAS